jgi:hypothetical protein
MVKLHKAMHSTSTSVRVALFMMISAPGIGSVFSHLKHQGINKLYSRVLGKSDDGGFGLLRLRGGGKFDENHAAIDVIQRNTKKGASLLPSAFENLVASTLFTAQVQNDELRMLKYLHIVSARSAESSKPLIDNLYLKELILIQGWYAGRSER